LIYFLIRDIHFGGGGERVTVNLADWFHDKGYNVTIVSIAVPQNNNIFNIKDEISIDYLGIDFKNGFNLFNNLKSIFKVREYFSK